LWQGVLTRGENAIVILPIVWEWDSEAYSQSQQSVDRQLPGWFGRQLNAVMQNIGSASPLDYPIRVPEPKSPDPASGDSLYPLFMPNVTTILGRTTPIDYLLLDGKPGTRPIGYQEASTPAMSAAGAVRPTASDRFIPQEIVLTYVSATSAAQTRRTETFLVPGSYEIRYADAHDHGDYSIFIQIERLDHP